MDPGPESPEAERLDAGAPERSDTDAAEDSGVCPVCHRHVCGGDSGPRGADVEDLRFDDVDATIDAGGNAEPATRADLPLNGEAADNAIGILFPHRDANRLGQWGPYEIERELGRGGMGIVFRGFDLVLHRAVAIKVMNPALAVGAQSRARFVRESRVMAAIRHPNIVAIHAVDQHGGIPFLVMEYVPGEGLDERIRRLGRLPIPEVLRVGALIADGLEAAHAQGTIHRDIKPANVMLGSENGEVKISDFGLALVMLENSDLTPADRLLGTPAYTAPEQIRGKAVDARADLFSLGCVIHAMAVGYSPFAGRNVIEVAHRVCDERPRRLDEIDPSVPRPLANLVLRLLEKDPERRIQTAAEAARSLRGAPPPVEDSASAGPIAPLLGEARTRARRRRHRRPRPWALAGLLVILGATILLDRGLQRRVARPAPPASSLELMAPGREPAHFRSLAEAIGHATPGSTVQLLAGEYEGPLRIDDPAKARGLIIEATAGAVLRAPPKAVAVVELRDAPGVVIRGLTIRRSSPRQHGVVLHGDVAGTRLEAVRVEPMDGARAAAVFATPGTRGAPDAPLLLRGLDVAAEGMGIVLGGSPSDQSVSFVRIEDSRIHGGGSLVMLDAAVHDVVLQGNILSDGDAGLNLALDDAATPVNVKARNNTFFNCVAWVNLGYTNPAIKGIDIARNLVLDCDSVATRTPDLAVVGPLWFRENLWRKSGAEVGLVARSIAAAPLLSTDPTSPDYLRPADAASVSVTDAATGETAHAGAVAPVAPSAAEAGTDPHL